MIKTMMKSSGLLLPLLGVAATVQAESGAGGENSNQDMLLLVALALGAGALLLAIFLAWYIEHRCGEKIGETRHVLSEQKRELQEVQQRLMMAEEKITILGRQVQEGVNRRESNNQPIAGRRLGLEDNFRIAQPAAEAVAPIQPSESEQLTRKCEEFTQAYIELQQKSGMEFKMARDEVQRKYGLLGFRCINSAERVNHQDIPPKFEEGENLSEADLWGFHVGAAYIMAPNMRGYTETYHDNAGMKELFDSNFVYGNTYKHVKLRRPAIMSGDLQILKKGDLFLS